MYTSIHTSACVDQVDNFQAVQQCVVHSHRLHNVSTGAKTPDHCTPSAQSCLGCCHGTLTKCTQEQSERVSSSSRSVCLIRPHFILLLLLQFIAKASETYIYLYCAVTVWRLEVHLFLQSRRVKSVYPWVCEFFTAE